MNIVKKPNKGTLIVEPVSNEQITQSGIIITESYETSIQKALVVHVGPLAYEDLCKPGDYVYMARHAGTDIGFSQLHIYENQVLFVTDK